MSSNFERFAQDIRESLSPQGRDLYEDLFDSFSVGLQIQQIRKEAHLTQAGLESLSGVPQSEISRIERGIVTPSYPRVRKIVHAMGGSAPILSPAATSAFMMMNRRNGDEVDG